MVYNYKELNMSKVTFRGIECEFTDVRVDRSTIPEKSFVYEVADGDCNGVPARIRPGIMVNFYGTLISPVPLQPDIGDTI